LWETGSATALVLAATGALILLINAAYQDGEAENLPPLSLRWAVRIAAVLLVPLVGIAAWGLTLRIGQHGLTPDRIIAVACTAVGAVHAAGYALSPLRPGDWMQPLERTNIAAAVLMVAVTLALFSPLADPRRLSVDNQLARLQSGAVSAEQFDYAFLKFDSGRHGQRALTRLTRSTNPEIARRAREANALDSRWAARRPEPDAPAPVIDVRPDGAALPEGFPDRIVGRANELGACIDRSPCTAAARDLDGDGAEEVLLAIGNGAHLRVFARAGESWVKVGTYSVTAPCDRSDSVPSAGQLLAEGVAAPARWPDLLIGDQRAGFSADRDCETASAFASAAPAP